MLHGLPPQMVVFERRKISNDWKLVTHGDHIAAGIFYHTETTNQIVCRLADPAYYLVFAQILTGGETSSLEVQNPTGGLLWRAREWKRTNFPQINTLVVVNPGTADPAYTVLTRAFAPYMHAGAHWFIQSTMSNELLVLKIASGIALSQQPALVAIWKLFDGQQATTQHQNILLGAQFNTAGGAVCVAITATDDCFWSIRRSVLRYRVTAPGATIGTITFLTLQNSPWHQTNVFGGTFTHDLIFRVSSHAGESVTGDFTVTARYLGGAIAATGVLNYGPTQTEYTFSIPAGLPIESVELSDLANADRFEFEVALNVTN